ncbi:MAG: hypothetical protein M0R37_13935 [Bacteroidales bacterium]|nr:hypothetical protein [Bacteroidales bacterium]
MIERLPLEGISELELYRRAESIRAQLRRGVLAARVDPMLARLREIDARLGRAPDRSGVEALARARARTGDPVRAELVAIAPPRAGRLDAVPADGLDVPALLRLRRALDTTSPGARGERVEALARRKRELDRLLGVTPSQYGALRRDVRIVTEGTIDLGAADLEHADRSRLQRRVIGAWRRGVVGTDRICGSTQHEPARQHALAAWRELTRCSLERILATKARRPGAPESLLRKEREAWRQAHLDADQPWPEEPTDAELEEAAARARPRVEPSRGEPLRGEPPKAEPPPVELCWVTGPRAKLGALQRALQDCAPGGEAGGEEPGG